jgi:CRISPR-associated endonuclease/helicase Cas3
LDEHLETVADLASQFGSKFGAGSVARLAGILHDIGKFNPRFQEYLRASFEAEQNGTPPPARGPQHAVYGARYARDHYEPLVIPLLGHHAGMHEIENARQRTEEVEDYAAVLKAASRFLEEHSFAPRLEREPSGVLEFEFLLRMIFSALVDADHLDTERHFNPFAHRQRRSEERGTQKRALLRTFEEDQERRYGTPPETGDPPINKLRCQLYVECVEAATGPQGFYELEAGTGLGKTRSFMSFALRHAIEHDLDRVIVVEPYLSIIEQVSEEYRNIFGAADVLEHHSAIDEDVAYRSRLATQNWDAPLVVTTAVQFFESLFSRRPSKARKLHNVARSVVVLR